MKEAGSKSQASHSWPEGSPCPRFSVTVVHFLAVGKAIFFNAPAHQMGLLRGPSNVSDTWRAAVLLALPMDTDGEEPGKTLEPYKNQLTPELCPERPQTRGGPQIHGFWNQNTSLIRHTLLLVQIAKKKKKKKIVDTHHVQVFHVSPTPLDTVLDRKGSTPEANSRSIKHNGKVWKLIEIFNRQCKP